MAVWLLLGVASCYVNADASYEAYKKYVGKFPDYAQHGVTVYELPVRSTISERSSAGRTPTADRGRALNHLMRIRERCPTSSA
jgi:hypothetical protein